ncbi:hypothetical protein N9X61_05125, partial [Sulfurimonas sp.]|nr:hypothetical protein [Sulfurimonas sp.]
MLHNKDGELKLYKQFGLFSFIVGLSVFSSLVYGGSFADFRKNQSTAFQNYQEENDREFTTYLKSDWEAYLLKEPLLAYEEAKPRELYPARNIVVKKQGPRVNIKIAKKEPEVKAKEAQKKSISMEPFDKKKGKIVLNTPEESVDKKDINFNFYGTQISLNIPQG